MDRVKCDLEDRFLTERLSTGVPEEMFNDNDAKLFFQGKLYYSNIRTARYNELQLFYNLEV